MMMKAEQFISLGYQRILTFERPGGGFDWWGNGEPLIWLTAYGVQQLTATSKVRDIDRGVIDRAYGFLIRNQDAEGAWNAVGSTHGETIAGVSNPRLALTAYVTWSLAEAGYQTAEVGKAMAYLKKHRTETKGNTYLLSLLANAFAFAAPKDSVTKDVFAELDSLKQTEGESVWWSCNGQTATCAYGNSANIETTAMTVYAMLKNGGYLATTVNRALNYIVKQKSSSGTWGSTQATILALKTLVAGDVMNTQGGKADVEIWCNGAHITTWKINDDNRDVMQMLDLGAQTKTGDNNVRLVVQGKANVMYQVVGRYYESWRREPVSAKQPIEIAVSYDRQKLVKNDHITATATMRYNGDKATFMVILDLGIPPGFSVDAGDFAELVGDKKIAKYSLTSRQITLYLGEVKPGQVFTCNYHLKAKYPLRAKSPKTIAYEYYAPDRLAEANPVELVVEEK